MVSAARRSLVLLGCLLLLGQGVCGATTIIDTYTGWNGISQLYPFGEPSYATFGQTFTAPTDDLSLDRFSFWLCWYNGAYPLDFSGYVMEWAGARATGPVLYKSPTRTLTNPTVNFTEFRFDTGGLELVGGREYIAFLCASEYFDGNWSQARMAWRENSYAGGRSAICSNGSDFGLLTSADWSTYGAPYETVCVMEFSEVPEPSSAALMLAGLGALVLVRRRRPAP